MCALECGGDRRRTMEDSLHKEEHHSPLEEIFILEDGLEVPKEEEELVLLFQFTGERFLCGGGLPEYCYFCGKSCFFRG